MRCHSFSKSVVVVNERHPFCWSRFLELSLPRLDFLDMSVSYFLGRSLFAVVGSHGISADGDGRRFLRLGHCSECDINLNIIIIIICWAPLNASCLVCFCGGGGNGDR